MNLHCQQACPLLDSYLTNELQVETLHAVNAHLAECGACRAALASRERARTAINTAVRNLVPDPDFAALVRDTVRAEATSRGPSKFLLSWVALAAALALISAIAWQWRADSALILARLSLGKGDHVFCARGGFYPDVPPTPAEMREQVGAPYAKLVDAVIGQAKGYVIREGHLCHWQDREFVHFILERNKKLVSIMLTRKQRPNEIFPRHALLAAMRAEGLPVYTTDDDGMAIAGLDAGQHLAFVISENGREEGVRLLAAMVPSLSTTK